MNDNKFWSKIGRHLTEHPYLPFLYLFVLIGLIIIGYSYFKGLLLEAEFRKGILVESFGMLFDLLIIGVIIGFIHSRGERRREIKRYMEEIDDFRGWEEPEAMYRIVGNIKRLLRLNVRNIDLRNCYLKGAKLYGINLKGLILHYTNIEKADLKFSNLSGLSFIVVRFDEAILVGADLSNIHAPINFFRYSNMVGANFENAHLEGSFFYKADFRDSNLKNVNFCNADLRKAKNLTIEQLAKVKTLWGAKLDPELEKKVKEKYPHLLEKPKEEE